ncbi:L-aspartate oxidase [Microbacterium thalli]|uniref:L-aspartate oxidase n=1 Tax=Microbacterium thalli TaxID=3027921 RepID=UPI0023657635|nr:L-aspartate oxidase [Microbacterium thalli]MDD7929530.1 L-aspartate oxidase [Microbacterium thalli]
MTTRVVLVGAGLAGGLCALRADRAGCSVVLLSKGPLGAGNTAYAQGGIAAAMGGDGDVASHLADTLAAGAGTVDPAAARVLVSAGAEVVDELAALGVVFDRDAAGALSLGLEGAHGRPRILHAGGDATGGAIQRALNTALRDSDVDIRPDTLATEVMIARGRARGVRTLFRGAETTIDADAVVLATGGAGRLFAHTTNPEVATADGIALALRAGARVADLEFVQFHPTALADGELISEAVRGEGAVLRDEAGHRFCVEAHPAAELAPRDVVARAIAAAMARQDGRPVRLDATAIRATERETASFLAERFPSIDRRLRARGLEWAREPIPVTPAAHYAMGGVATDLDGRTSVPGLYAVGEVARTGVHGANRLASNSLLEAAVFAARAASAVALDRPRREPGLAGALGGATVVVPPVSGPPTGSPDGLPPFSRAALQHLMWKHVGLHRDAAGLRHALATLDAWTAEPAEPRSAGEHEDANLLLVARTLTRAALARSQSLGSHYRSDDPAGRTASALLSDKVA